MIPTFAYDTGEVHLEPEPDPIDEDHSGMGGFILIGIPAIIAIIIISVIGYKKSEK